MGKTQILFLSALPEGQDDTSCVQAAREIREKIAKYENYVDLQQEHRISVSELQDLLLTRYTPQIVHFYGHGAKSFLLLEDDKGDIQEANLRAFANMFRLLNGRHEIPEERKIRCVVLVACNSNRIAKAVSEYVDCAIGMKTEIGVDLGREFAKSFYYYLCSGKSVKFSFEFACNLIGFTDPKDQNSPILEPRSGCDPDTIFFTQMRRKREVNIYDIGQYIYSIGREDGQTVGSAFLLGNTGFLVTDSTILRSLGQGISRGVKAKVRPFAFTDGAVIYAELVVTPEMVLDYAVFRIMRTPEVSPLRLSDNLPSIGDAVTACISHGESQGFHDGTITGVNLSVPIKIGVNRTETITNLIETNIKVSEGACGSPIIRKDGRVVGVIVAGSDRLSYALTSLRLREILRRGGLPSGT